MLLSICMMVKDEESNLERCLKSLESIRSQIDSELIILDTGSTDRTVEIAQKYTSQIYHHTWNNSFADMRNISISYAKGEWLFIIDADEEIEDPFGIIDVFSNKKSLDSYNAFSLQGRNFLFKNNLNIFSDVVSMRFFRNDGEFHYKSIVHNLPVFKYPVGHIGGLLNHYGYINDDPVLMEKKFQRTATLLKEILEKDPSNIYFRYQLSVSYAMNKNWDVAEMECLKAYNLIKKKPLQEKQKYFYLYGHLMKIYKHLEQFEKVILFAEEALKISKNDMDSCFFMADALIILNRRKDAVFYLEKYVELINLYSKGQIEIYLDMNFETVHFAYLGLCNLLTILSENEDYDKIINLCKRYSSYVGGSSVEEENCRTVAIFIESVIKKGNYHLFVEYYEKSNDQLQRYLSSQLEKRLRFESDYEQKKVVSIMKELPDQYGLYNRLKYTFVNEGIWMPNTAETIETLSDEESTFWADLVFEYYLFNNQSQQFVEWVLLHQLYNDMEIIDRLSHLSDKFMQWAVTYLSKNAESCIPELIFRQNIAKYILLTYQSDHQEKQALGMFELYTHLGHTMLEKILKNEIMSDSKKWIGLENKNYRFFLNMKSALLANATEVSKYVKAALNDSEELESYVVAWVKRLSENEKDKQQDTNAEGEIEHA